MCGHRFRSWLLQSHQGTLTPAAPRAHNMFSLNPTLQGAECFNFSKAGTHPRTLGSAPLSLGCGSVTLLTTMAFCPLSTSNSWAPSAPPDATPVTPRSCWHYQLCLLFHALLSINSPCGELCATGCASFMTQLYCLIAILVLGALLGLNLKPWLD